MRNVEIVEKSRMDIVELKQQYPLNEIARMVGIKIVGERDDYWSAHCPFHPDNTPSFVIYKKNQLAKCFSTACASLPMLDHLRLVQEIFHLNKEQAEEKLYLLVGVERPINNLHDVLSRAMNRLTENISMDYPKDFFQRRGVSEQVLRDMMVGYSPSFESFRQAIQDLPQDEVAKLELYRAEMFDNAIIYPTFDMLGRISGFRSRPETSFVKSMKYIANRGTFPLKATRAYGLHNVRNRQIILVEGPNDVLSMRSAGIRNVAGLMGNNVRGLDRYLTSIGFDDVVFIVDGEAAGVAAMAQAPNLVRVNQIPDGLDPDELIVQRGAGAMIDLINESEFPFWRRFKARTKKVPSNMTGKIMLIKSIAKDLSDGLPSIVIDKMQEEIAQELKIPIDHVSSIFDMIDIDTDKLESAIIWHIHNETDLGRELSSTVHAGMFANPYYRRQFEELNVGLTPGESIHEAKDLTEADVTQFISLANRRKIRNHLRTAIGDIANVSQPVEDVMSRLTVKLSDVDFGGIEVIDAHQQLGLGVDNAIEKSRNPNKLMGISFGKGFSYTDYVLSGIRPQAMYVLAATAGVGKSNVSLQWAINIACDQGIPLLWLSLEMSELEMSIRSLAKLTKLSARRIQVGDISDAQLAMLTQAKMQYGNSPFYLASCGTVDIYQIVSLVRKFCITKKIQVVFLDYIGLIRGEEGSGMYERIGAISRAIKMNITRDKSLGIPVIAVAQLSKVAAKLSVPTSEQIAESYKIAQDADVLMTLRRRPESEILEGQRQGKKLGNLTLFFDKNRSGTSKEHVELLWSSDHLSVEEVK